MSLSKSGSEIITLLFHRIEVGVGPFGIEDFVTVHYGDKVLSIRKIDDVVGIAWEHYDALNLVAANLEFEYLRIAVFVQLVRPRVFRTHLNQPVAFDHDELFPFAVMPMLPLCDPWFADVDADLSTVEGVN